MRYADDVRVFVRSERAANRVLDGIIVDVVEGRLKLKVNRHESSISTASVATLLGFGFYFAPGGRVGVRVAPRAFKRLKMRLKQLTRRSRRPTTRTRSIRSRSCRRVSGCGWTISPPTSWTRRVWPTVRGAEGDLPRIEDGALTLPITEGDIDGGNTGPISFVGQPIPEGEWEATVHLDIDHSNEWQHVGLMQHVDDDNYIKFAFTQNPQGHRFFEFQTETDGSRVWHGDNIDVDGDFPTEVWMRLQSDGSELTASFSTDGEDFEVFEETATPFDGGALGIVGAGDTSSDTIDATVYSYTFSPDEAPADSGPDDEFEGEALNGSIWDRTVRYNPETLWVEDGQLHIETLPGDIHGGDNTDPRNFVLQDAPSGDRTIETQLEAPLLDNW